MKNLMALLLCLLTLNVFAGGDSIDDIYSGGEDDFEFERFSDNQILLAIDADAEIACSNGLCTMHSVTNKYGGFEVSFNVGEGNSNNSGSGTIINLGDDQYGSDCSTCPSQYWGVEIKYSKGSCTQTVNVPRSVYYSVNRYMYGLMTEKGGTRKGFTPADEAMIMFYTTIISKASGCTIQ